jgi:hypothetical protein
MKRVLTTLAVAGGVSILAVSVAAAQSLGGFPIREPGGASVGGSGSQGGSRDEVIVSQSPDSKIRTVAEAMRVVKPGGTIIVQGGIYEENLVLTKAVSIRGVADAYGRNVVFRPTADKACVTVAPETPLAPVSLNQVIFKFDSVRFGAPCIDVAGGSFTMRDSFVIPADADIPVRAAYGQMMPQLLDHIGRPPRDGSAPTEYEQRLEEHAARHARMGQPAGAENGNWSFMTGGTNLENILHTRATQSGPLSGPAAGIRVAAGDVRLEGNVVIGAMVGVSFASRDEALIRGTLSNNVLLGNGIGIGVHGIAADLVVTRNTVRYNQGPGIKADVYEGLKLYGNELRGNERGIEFSERVRSATISSNLIVGNLQDAMKVSSAFYGAVAANTIAENGGCTIQFYSAEQKILNNVERKVTAFEDFQPALVYEETNYAEDNDGDKGKKKRRNKRKAQPVSTLAPCAAPLSGSFDLGAAYDRRSDY